MAISQGNSWHVRASIGTELGPIDTDTLLTMAESGLLCDADVVRGASQSEWRPLATVLNELRSAQPMSPPPQSQPLARTNLPRPVHVSLDDQPPIRTVDSKPNVNLELNPPVRSKPLPGWLDSSPTATRRVSLRQESSEKPSAPPVDSEAGSSLLESWKDQRRETIDRLLAKVAEREAAAIIDSDAKMEARDETSLDFDEPLPTDGSYTADDANELNRAPAATSPSQQESFPEMRDRWRRSLPSWPVLTAVVLIVGLVITYWPTSISQSRTVARFHEIYVKLERLRHHPLDRTGMEDFSRATVAELNVLIPQLTERAGDHDQDSKALLWMARDCLLPMLKSPRNRDSRPERDLQMLLTAWDKRHQTTYAVMPDPDEP